MFLWSCCGLMGIAWSEDVRRSRSKGNRRSLDSVCMVMACWIWYLVSEKFLFAQLLVVISFDQWAVVEFEFRPPLRRFLFVTKNVFDVVTASRWSFIFPKGPRWCSMRWRVRILFEWFCCFIKGGLDCEFSDWEAILCNAIFIFIILFLELFSAFSDITLKRGSCALFIIVIIFPEVWRMFGNLCAFSALRDCIFSSIREHLNARSAADRQRDSVEYLNFWRQPTVFLIFFESQVDKFQMTARMFDSSSDAMSF